MHEPIAPKPDTEEIKEFFGNLLGAILVGTIEDQSK